MSRPRKFRIAGNDWEIVYKPHKDWPTEDSESIGVTYSNQHRLLIKTSDKDEPYSEGNIRDTVMHELLHACYFVTGATHSDSPLSEEDTIRIIQPALLAVLRDNIVLSRYLLT